MTTNEGKTSITKRLSYAASDTAGQLVFCVISFYLLKFYTDVYGISAAGGRNHSAHGASGGCCRCAGVGNHF